MDSSKRTDDIGENAVQGILGPNPFVGFRGEDVLATLGALGREVARHPNLVIEQQAGLARELIQIIAGKATTEPASTDKRFADSAWKDNPFYERFVAGYLSWDKSLNDLIDKTTFDARTKEQARFVTRLWTDALSPSNWPLNPVALKRAVDTGGKSGVDGVKNLLWDILHNGGMPTQVDKSAFRVGENLGISEGSVVFRNDVLELIQYRPVTGDVHVRPTLFIPPQINKFYVFDLAPGRSLVELMTKNGIQVFCVSWRNPTAEQRDWNLDTYVLALDEAIGAVQQICSVHDVNIMGACSGGMTQTALMGYYAATDRSFINAATMLVAVLQSPEDTSLSLFTSPETVAAAKAASAAKGVLDGKDMSRVFAWLRPNDLVWNYWVNNYLLGNPPPAFDILYWNSDTTNLPAKFHGELLDIFLDNTFKTGIDVLGKRIDLAQITLDKFVVAGVTDHITPWKTVYKTTLMFGAGSEMILSASGHIQSLINPPGNKKSKYFTNPDRPAKPEAWLEGATVTEGSWWGRWATWTIEHSGEKKSAPAELGNATFPPIGKAPGEYVFQ